MDVSDEKLCESCFDDVNLARTRFNNVNLSGALFTDIDMTEVIFKNVCFVRAEISDANLSGMKINGILVTDLLEVYEKLHC